MLKIIAIILLAISTAGAGYFGWTQKNTSAAATEQVAELTQKVEESDKKVEATEAELAASKEMLPPLMAVVPPALVVMLLSLSPAALLRNASRLPSRPTTLRMHSTRCAWLDSSSRSYHLRKPSCRMPSASGRFNGLGAGMAGSGGGQPWWHAGPARAGGAFDKLADLLKG